MTAAFFGDGALEEGVSYEALNIASLCKLPVLFVCENNSVDAWGTARDGFPTLVHASTDLCSIAGSLDIEAVRVDGTDATGSRCRRDRGHRRAATASGPVFIEAVTKRWAGSNPLWPELATGETESRMAWRRGANRRRARDWYRHFDPVLRLARTSPRAGNRGVERLNLLDREIRDA